MESDTLDKTILLSRSYSQDIEGFTFYIKSLIYGTLQRDHFI